MSESELRKRTKQSHQSLEDDEFREDENEEDTELLQLGGQDEEEEETEELWDDSDRVAEVLVGDKPYKRKDVLRKTVAETGLRLLVHLLLLGVYMALHIHCANQFKRCPHQQRVKIFYGGVMFGGLWKFFSYICMWTIGVYFFLGFFMDILPLSSAKQWFRRLCDWLFTTIVWPMAWTEVVIFWVFNSIDEGMLRSESVDACVPETLKHGWHTLPAVAVMLECVLVYHNYPSQLVAGFTILITYTAYGAWMLLIFSLTNVWVYPFLGSFNPVTFILGMFLFGVFGIILYYFGVLVAYFRWSERFQAEHELESEKM